MRLEVKTGFPAVMLPLLLIVTACSIRESRQPCPFWAVINLDRFVELNDYQDVMTGVIVSNRIIEKETVTLSDYGSQPYEKQLKNRIPTTVSAACGYEAMSVCSDSLVCNRGAEVSRVWTTSLTQDCNDDVICFDLHPHKDYTTITFVVLGIAGADEFMYDMRVRANYNGIRLRDRKPVEGAYLAYLRPREAGVTFEVRVPRQADDEMVLDMLAPRVDRDYTVDDRIDVITLGRRLKSQGYDWDKEDLDDVVVTIDYARLSTSISVDEWDDETINENI